MTDKKKQTLSRIARCLNNANVTWALGASAMMSLRGIVETFNDIDIMVAEDDIDKAYDVISSIGELQPFKADDRFHTSCFYEFIVDDIDVDLISGFAIVSHGRIHQCALRIEEIDAIADVYGSDVPLHSLAVWKRYYSLMGRPDKVSVISAWHTPLISDEEQ